jgi:hypothetical protein
MNGGGHKHSSDIVGKRTVKQVKNNIKRIFAFDNKDLEDFPLWKRIEYTVTCCTESGDFSFSDPELRLGPYLPLLGFLLNMMGKNVLFLSPTHYYAIQATKMINRWRNNLVQTPTPDFPFLRCAVPQGWNFSVDDLRDANVVLMHGKDFTNNLPEHEKTYQKIVQEFKEENVPCDPDSYVTCCSFLPPSQFE